jgi:hypothetical protein
MKKSFLYVLSAALLLTLSLSGCPQDADDDDDDPKPKEIVVNPPTSDLSYIAYAFGQEDISTVKAVNDISLENNELVIPAGKTLDLGSFKLDSLTANSKIIIWGNGEIKFGERQGGALDLTKVPAAPGSPGAKIIANKEFINANVFVDYTYNENEMTDGRAYTTDDWDKAKISEADRPGLKEKAGAKYWANWDQVVVIDTFETFTNYQSVDTTAAGYEAETSDPAGRGYRYDGRYVAIFAPEADSLIGTSQVDVINEKAKDLCFYLVGLPVKFSFSGNIDITGVADPKKSYYKDWRPAAIEPSQNRLSVFNYAVGDDFDPEGSLVIAGNVSFESGSVKATALTVWGVIESESKVGENKPSITAQDTPLTAWTVRLQGAAFNGDVNLLGSAIGNTFGGAVVFGGKTKITGPATFGAAIFEKAVVLSGPVVFSGEKKGTVQVEFKDDTTFGDNAYIYSDVKFNPSSTNIYYKELKGLSTEEIGTANLQAGDKDATLVVEDTEITPGTFNIKITFSNPVTAKSGGSNTYTFNKGVIFKNMLTMADNVNFAITGDSEFDGVVIGGGSITATVGSTSVFRNDVNLAYGEFAGPVTVTGNANITNAILLGNTSITGDATINAGSFGAVTSITGDAEITAGTFAGTTTITGAATFDYGSFSAVFNANGTATFTEPVYLAGDIKGEGSAVFETGGHFGGSITLAGATFNESVTFPDEGNFIKITGDVTFGSYASLQNSEIDFGNAVFEEGGSLGTNGGKINTATFGKDGLEETIEFISSGNLILTDAGITLPGNGTIAVPIGGLVSLNNGISISGHGSIGPAIVFNGHGLTLDEGAVLTLIGGESNDKYIDFVKASDSGAGGFDVTNGVGTLAFGSFSANESTSTPTITLKGNSEFLIDSESATNYETTAGSFTLYNTILDLSGGSVTFGGTGNMLIMANGGNLTVRNDASGSGSALNPDDVGKLGIIITTANASNAAVLVSGTLGADGAYGTVGTLDVGFITNKSLFQGTMAYSGTSATAGSQAAFEAEESSGTEDIAVFSTIN